MSLVHIDIAARRGGFHLQAAFQAESPGITALFGPSGSGKTSLLRAIAGLEAHATGVVRIGDRVWLDSARGISMPVHRRGIGYVFQEGNLFEHLDVRGNLDYALRRATTATRTLTEVADWAGINHLLDRRVTALSGGERNRVALARSLLSQPSLLLLDEPLAALDAPARAEWVTLLQQLPRVHGIPIIYVSHALDEVTQLADRVVVLRDGQVQCQGYLSDLLTALDSPLSLGAEAGALIDAEVAGFERQHDLAVLRFDGGELRVPDHALAVQQRVRVRILARDVSLSLAAHTDTSILNILPVTVIALAPEGAAQMRVQLAAGGGTLLARVTRKSVAHLELVPGKNLFAQVKSVALLA